MIRLAIVEDISEVREGLKYLLSMDKQITVTGVYKRAEDFIEGLGKASGEQHAKGYFSEVIPDVVLMDIKLPGMDGIEATRLIKEKFPDITVLILTIFEDEDLILDSIEAGADGYILKNTKPGLLTEQIKSAFNGGSPISPMVARRILSEIRREKQVKSKRREDARDYNLTPREREILKDIVDGFTYREIAERHYIAGSTVKKHILHIYQKLKVTSKAEFVKKVIEEDLI